MKDKPKFIIEVRDDRIMGHSASGEPWPPAYWRGPDPIHVTGTKSNAFGFYSRQAAEEVAEEFNEEIPNHTFTVKRK
jgi:hypothetical protein